MIGYVRAVCVAICGLTATDFASASNAAPAQKWFAIETTHSAWHKGAAHYTFAIEEDRSGIGQGDETSPRLRIVGPDGKSTVFGAEGGWTTLTADPGLEPPTKNNLLRSNYLYLTMKLTNAAGEPMLFMFGQAFASDPGAVRIITLDSNGVPHIALAVETFDVMALKDLDHDGAREVIGTRTLSQTSGECEETYDPVSVFKLAQARDRLSYSESLSRKYMEAHGLEWAGPKAREDISVSTCGPNKGRIVKQIRQ